MVPIAQEKNVEVLRQYTFWLEAQVKDLSLKLSEIQKQGDDSKQVALDESMRDQLARLRQKFFGVGREELEGEADTLFARPVGHEEAQLKLHGEYPYAVAEVVEKPPIDLSGDVFFTYKMSERELAVESSLRGLAAGAEAWVEVPGLYQESQMVTIYERVYKEHLHRQVKYRLKKEFNDTGKEVLVTAPGPAKVRPGSKYSIDFAVSVVSDKYEFHMPLERQRRKMEAAGLAVEVKTLYGLCEAVAEHGEAVREGIRQDIMEDFSAVHVDESPWPIMGAGKQSYMWVLSNRRGAYFQFEPSRSGAVAKELLKRYQGSVVTDGFSGYNGLRARGQFLRMGHCWSHARREFFERVPDYPVEATRAVKLIDELFAIESRAMNFEELRVLRQTESAAVISQFRDFLHETVPKFLPQSGINGAISYCFKFWPELTRFLKDLSLPLSNNDAERSLRHVVMGRKNFNGSKTVNGADTAATLYTVIESCKRVGLQPSQYLKYLIDARWFGDAVQTPFAYAMEKLGPSTKIIFPGNEDWKIA
jgi:transposase